VDEARLLKWAVLKEARATFSVTPGLDACRPAQTTAFGNLFVAGDWTDTGWPSTMEGAIRGGRLAAGVLAGDRRRFLSSELPATGLMRLLSRCWRFVDGAGTAFRGEVEVGFGDVGPGLFFDFGDHFGGVFADAYATAVVGGEAESFEDGVGVAVGDASGDEGIDGAGDGDLDGFAILERGKAEEWRMGDEPREGDLVAV
jgi:hypothetical protein